jgi:hypothetical protein
MYLPLFSSRISVLMENIKSHADCVGSVPRHGNKCHMEWWSSAGSIKNFEILTTREQTADQAATPLQ